MRSHRLPIKSDRTIQPQLIRSRMTTTLTQPKLQTQTLTYFDGEFDAIIGLLPQVMELDSPYYQGYLAASLKFDLVPF